MGRKRKVRKDPGPEEFDFGAPALPKSASKPKPTKELKPKSPQKPKTPISKDICINNTRDNSLISDNEVIRDIIEVDDINKTFRLKDQMTEKELKFIGLYLTGEYTQLNAMKLAGYIGYNDKYLEILARKIIVKYESKAQDHREIIRAMGAGEVFVINQVISLIKTSKSEFIKTKNIENLAKWLGMSKDLIEGITQGIAIIIKGYDPDQAQVQGPGPPGLPAPGQSYEHPGIPGKPVHITK